MLFGLLILQGVLGARGENVELLGALHAVNPLLVLGSAMLAAADARCDRPHHAA